MAKRTRKPPVKPEVGRDWLRRYEEHGDSPPQIALADGFDVRTVRKQIDLARQEREVREARALVLRNALELHYDDLRKCAERLNSEILGIASAPPSPDEELLEAALRQHAPRSPIWGYLLKRRELQQRADEQREHVRAVMEKAATADGRLVSLSAGGLNEVVRGVVTALVAQAKELSDGELGLNLSDDLVAEPAGEGYRMLRWGPVKMGKIEARQAESYIRTALEVLRDLEARLTKSPAYLDLEKTAAEIRRLDRKLREELAVIRLRRIIPGRCKFCPL